MAIDRRRWERQLLYFLDIAEALGDVAPEQLAIEMYVHLRRSLWINHLELAGPHADAGCHLCEELHDQYRDPGPFRAP